MCDSCRVSANGKACNNQLDNGRNGWSMSHTRTRLDILLQCSHYKNSLFASWSLEESTFLALDSQFIGEYSCVVEWTESTGPQTEQIELLVCIYGESMASLFSSL